MNEPDPLLRLAQVVREAMPTLDTYVQEAPTQIVRRCGARVPWASPGPSTPPRRKCLNWATQNFVPGWSNSAPNQHRRSFAVNCLITVVSQFEVASRAWG